MATIIKCEKGFIDELVGIILAMIVGLMIIALIIPIQAYIQDVSVIHNAIELAAQSALPYDFPTEEQQAQSESNQVFYARIGNLQHVNCNNPTEQLENYNNSEHYVVNAQCTIQVIFGPISYTDTINPTASVQISAYQGVSG